MCLIYFVHDRTVIGYAHAIMGQMPNKITPLNTYYREVFTVTQKYAMSFIGSLIGIMITAIIIKLNEWRI
jgi:p-aminobenzoyl-glutamate transporter AbgT